MRGKRPSTPSKDASNTITKTQQRALQQPAAQQPIDMPRIQRADSRVRVQQVLPILQPSSAEIEELTEQQLQLKEEQYEQQFHEPSKVVDNIHDLSSSPSSSFPSTLETPSNTLMPPESPATPLDECIQRGIQYHEKGDVDQATAEFKYAAEEGSPMGMFFYGLALRHGWVT